MAHSADAEVERLSSAGPGREQLRLFCLLENGTSDELAKRGLSRPAIAVITGLRKPWRTVFSERDAHGVGLGDVPRYSRSRRSAVLGGADVLVEAEPVDGIVVRLNGG